MSDQRLRQLERQAASGDVEALSALYIERVRIGNLTRDRLELAAYCGNTAALEVLGWSSPCNLSYHGLPDVGCPCTDIGSWLSGLEHWPLTVPIRATCAAARVAFMHVDVTTLSPCPTLGVARILDAIRAAEAYVACPCESHLRAWDAAWDSATDLNVRPLFIPCARFAIERPIRELQIVSEDAAELAGEPAVRTAIREKLIEWALA